MEGRLGDQDVTSVYSGAPVGPTMRMDFPEVETFLRFRNRGTYLVKYENHHFQEEKLIFADSTLSKVFSLHLVEGDPETALIQPNTIVITEKAAQKYFGSEDPLGKALVLDNKQSYRVTGVLFINCKAPGISLHRGNHFHTPSWMSASIRCTSQNNGLVKLLAPFPSWLS